MGTSHCGVWQGEVGRGVSTAVTHTLRALVRGGGAETPLRPCTCTISTGIITGESGIRREEGVGGVKIYISNESIVSPSSETLHESRKRTRTFSGLFVRISTFTYPP